MNNPLVAYQPVIADLKNLIAAGQHAAYHSANHAMIMTYWNIGKRIVEEEQNGAVRAEYGKRLIAVSCRCADKGVWKQLFQPEPSLLPQILSVFF